jgi:tetratricopeptide (TPR) repeat protein
LIVRSLTTTKQSRSIRKCRHYNNRGAAYKEKGDYDRAITDLDQPIQLCKRHSHRGSAYGRKGDYARAIADLNTELALNSKYTRGYSNRAAIYELHGDLHHAIACANEAIDSIRRMHRPTTGAAKPTPTRSSMT